MWICRARGAGSSWSRIRPTRIAVPRCWSSSTPGTGSPRFTPPDPVDGAPPRERLVIVGNGMPGARLVDDITRRAPGRYTITVIGAEPVPAYNRILLSAVLAGDKALADIMLARAASPDVTVLTGEAVTGIERAERIVRTAAGRAVAYDALVLAT